MLDITSQSIETSVPANALLGRKVLIIVENLPIPFDRRVWQEARTLKAAGATVSVICPTGKGFETRYEVIDGIHIHRHPLPLDASSAREYLIEYMAALFWQTRLAWKVFFGVGFDVIHACNPPDLIFLVALPFKLLGRKFIFDHHDINPELYEAKFGKRGFFWKLLVLIEKLTFKAANITIATNDSYRQIAIERGGKKPEDVYVVRSGPDLSRFKKVPANLAHKKGRQFMIGYVGVMGDQEGIDLLLESATYIIHKLGRQDIQFCLVGGGPSLEALKALSNSLNLSDYVTFLGRAPDNDLFEVLSTADVCVNPDRVNPMNNLSTMNKILEYMTIGKPIVQFEVREGRISAGESSLYAIKNDPIDFANKIIQLLGDDKLRQKMGEIGQDRVTENFSWQQQVPNLIAAYQATAPKS
jgi:glycosyltransferase involved in cell wall biosynthesis